MPSLQVTSAASATESHASFTPGNGAKSTEEGWQTRGQGSVPASEKQVVEEGEPWVSLHLATKTSSNAPTPFS